MERRRSKGAPSSPPSQAEGSYFGKSTIPKYGLEDTVAGSSRQPDTTQPTDHIQRDRYTKEILEGHINTLLNEMPNVTRIGNTSIAHLWKDKLTKGEIEDIKEIARNLRENRYLDNKVPGKDGKKLYVSIVDLATMSNPENKAKSAKVKAAYIAKPENAKLRGERHALYRQNPEYRERELEQQAKRRAKRLDEEAKEYERTFSPGTQDQPGSSQGFTPAQGGSFINFQLDNPHTKSDQEE